MDIHEVKVRGTGILERVHQSPCIWLAGKANSDITMRPFRPTVLDVAKYFDDRMTIGYSVHAIRVKRPARPRLGC